MKHTLTFFFSLLSWAAYSQSSTVEYRPKSECNNYNTFMQSPAALAALKYYADTIYPGGTLSFDWARSAEFNGMESLYPYLDLPSGTTFQLENSSTFEGRTYARYQQYYHGVKVEGSGYTYSERGPTGGDPCIQADLFSPYIASDVYLNTNPSVATGSLKGIVLDLIHQSDAAVQDVALNQELVIVHNLLNDCAYRLVWQVDYGHKGGKTTWIDAHSGVAIKTIDTDMHLNAPTEVYGNQNLNDHNLGNGTTKLETPDGSIVVYDFSELVNCIDVGLINYQSNLIPITTDSQWTEAVAPKGLYQAFYVAGRVIPVYENLGIDFGKVNLGVNCLESNSFAFGFSSMGNAFLSIGTNGTHSWALYDKIGHELSHVYLFQFLAYTNLGNRTLHEGISDMLGTYVESVIQGNIDWKSGDDAPTIPGTNLAAPQFDCFTDAANFAFQHNRAQPLGHWFYLITTGSASNNIPALGIEKALSIVLNAVKSLGPESDYAEFREKTLAFVGKEYGPCSDEMKSIGSAWDAICVGPPFNDCAYTIEGPKQVCEESNSLQLCIGGGLPNMHYRWYFPPGWAVDGNVSGNILSDAICLNVTQFPTYSHYPRYFTIEVYSPIAGTQLIQKKQVKLVDCDGDDPTCEAYFENQEQKSLGASDVNNVYGQNEAYPTIRVFDILGNLLYEKKGENVGFDPYLVSIAHTGMVFYFYSDQDGKIVKTQKVVLVK